MNDRANDRRQGTGPLPSILAATQLDPGASGASPRSLVGWTLDGRYEILETLGQGGMGTVFKARHKLLDELVALKVIKEGLLDGTKVRARFLREARATMRFVHPNVIPVREVGVAPEGFLYMTLDYSPGKNLRAIIKESGRLPERRAIEIVRQCLLALEAAHAHGIVHRDLKPENVLVEAGEKPGEDVVKIVDFGLAKLLDSSLESGDNLTGCAVVGTPHYMAPEQASGGDTDARTDIYSLGCMLYELVTGTKVFDANSASKVLLKHLTQTPEPPSKRAPGMSPKLEALILRTLAKEPADRPASAGEFREGLAGIDARLRGSRKLHVLLAEDNVVNQKLTQRMVERWGHAVVVVANGRDALARLETEPFDVVLMDGQMPVLDGFAAATALRQREAGSSRHLPIIALTAVTTAADRERCRAAGMDAHVAKPIDPEELFEAIERATRPAVNGATKDLLDSRELDGVFDTAAALARVDGDVELLREVVDLFLADAPKLIVEIRSAFGAKDMARAARAAYELKGVAGNCGAMAVEAAAARLESLDGAAGPENVEPALASLEAAFDRLRPALIALKERGISCAC